MYYKQKGFTLIEVMVVVVILGILASLIVPKIISRPDEAKIIKAKQDIMALENALELYRLDKETRQRLRLHIRADEILNFHQNFVDEGIMHRLAVLAKFEIDEKTYLPGSHWNRGSFEEGVEEAALIHIRPKITPIGPKRPKIVNYKDLVKKGFIE